MVLRDLDGGAWAGVPVLEDPGVPREEGTSAAPQGPSAQPEGPSAAAGHRRAGLQVRAAAGLREGARAPSVELPRQRSPFPFRSSPRGPGGGNGPAGPGPGGIPGPRDGGAPNAGTGGAGTPAMGLGPEGGPDLPSSSGL